MKSSLTDRQIQSRTWLKSRAYSLFYYVNRDYLPHYNRDLVTAAASLTAVFQISIVFSPTIGSDGIPLSSCSRWVFWILQKQFSLKRVSKSYLDMLTVILFVLEFAIIGTLGLVIYRNSRGLSRSRSNRTLLTVLGGVVWLLLTMLLVPSIDLCVYSIKLDTDPYRLFAILVLLLLPVLLLTHNILTQDFSFVRQNFEQGRDYSYFALKTLVLITISLLYFSQEDTQSFQTRLAINLLHAALGGFVLSYRLAVRVHHYYGLWGQVILLLDCIPPLVAAFSSLALYFEVFMAYFDIVIITGIGLIYWFLINLALKRGPLGETKSLVDFTNLTKARQVLEDLSLSLHKRLGEEEEMLATGKIVEHCSQCADPYCLCFLLRINFDKRVGAAATKGAREIYRRFQIQKGHRDNKLTNFRDIHTIDAIRFGHSGLISAKITGKHSAVQIYKEDNITEANIGFILSLDNQDDLNKFVAGLFSTIRHNNSQSRSSQFNFTVSNIGYLLTEYKNPVSALLLLYDYIYSRRYAREHSILKDVQLQNLMQLARYQLLDSEKEFESSKYILERLNFSTVLDYRLRTHELRAVIQDMVIQKVDVYSLLGKKLIDFKELSNRGENLHREIKLYQKEINQLLDINGLNTKLTREALIFELCVLERPIISSGLRQHYREAFYDMRHRVGSIKNEYSRLRYNPYNSSNIVIFSRQYEDSSYRIVRFTHNASQLLGMTEKEIYSSKLTEFIPETIAEKHDNLINAYLNGHSNPNSRGKKQVPVISKKGNARSVTMIFRPEFSFLDDIFIAALITVRKKNHFPLLFTDMSGKIVGANNQAMKLLASNSKIHENALFVLFPRLLKLYFPNLQLSNEEPMSNSGDKKEELIEDSAMDRTVMQKLVGTQEEENMDLFLFQMFYRSILNLSEGSRAGDIPSKTPGKGANRTGGENSMLHSHSTYSRGVGSNNYVLISQVLKRHRKLLNQNATKIFRCRVEIETNYFQHGLHIREVKLETLHRTKDRIQNFYKNFANHESVSLIDALLLGPDTLNNLYKVSEMELFLQSYNRSINVEKVRDHRRNKSSDPKIQSFNSDIRTSLEVKEKGALTVAKGQGLEPVPAKYGINLIGTLGSPKAIQSDLNSQQDTYNAQIKPTQIVSDVEALSSDLRLSLVQNNSQKDLRLPVENSSIVKTMNLTTNDKVAKTKQALELLKQELFKDNDFERIQIAAEGIMKATLLNGGNTLKLSSNLAHSLAHMQNTPYIKDLMRQDSLGGDMSIRAADSESSDMDSQREVKVEYSDPLKTVVNQEEPSTFMMSSSKVSMKSSQDASLIRTRIQKSRSRLRFRKYEYFTYSLCILLCISKVIFKSLYDDSISNIFEYEKSVNQIANILRPTGFAYKESVKGWVQEQIYYSFKSLPDNMIYYKSQVNHYTAAYRRNLGDLFKFYSDGLAMQHSFIESLPESKISIFGMVSSLLNNYITMSDKITNVRDQSDSSFITANTYLWNESRRLSRKIFKELYWNFIEQDEKRAANLRTTNTLFSMNMLTNLLIWLLFILMSVVIARSIQDQLFQAAELLLRVDKNTYILSLRKFIRNTTGVAVETHKQKKEYKKAIMNHLKHLDHIDSESSFLMGGGKRAEANRGRGNEEESALRNYSVFVNFPEKGLGVAGLTALVALLVVNIPTLVNLFYLLSFHDTLTSSLDTSASTNLASSAFYFVAAVQYREYVWRAMPEKVSEIDPELREIKQTLQKYVERAKTIKEPFLISQMKQIQTCEEVTKLVDLRQGELCLMATESGVDFSLFEGLQDISLKIDLLNREIETATKESVTSYFEDPRFVYFDLQLFAQTVVMKDLAGKYMQRILGSISSAGAASNLMMATFLVSLSLAMLASHFVWIVLKLRYWRQLEATFLILNDDIISSVYIRSYFGQVSR